MICQIRWTIDLGDTFQPEDPEDHHGCSLTVSHPGPCRCACGATLDPFDLALRRALENPNP